jgi:hypothetical protein
MACGVWRAARGVRHEAVRGAACPPSLLAVVVGGWRGRGQRRRILEQNRTPSSQKVQMGFRTLL